MKVDAMIRIWNRIARSGAQVTRIGTSAMSTEQLSNIITSMNTSIASQVVRYVRSGGLLDGLV
jgi:hypothetical protein